MKFQKVRVGDVLEIQRRSIVVDLVREYEEIGIRSFGKGIFHKKPVSGADLGTKRVFRIEPGDLVISNVFAWEGAIAVASEAEEGKIGSHRFMTFVPKDDRVDTSWAAWYFRSEQGLELIRKASPGSAGRNRTLAIDRFETLEIPLPPIDEQRRTGGRLDEVSHAVSELIRRSERVSELSGAFAVSASARPDLDDSARARLGWRRVPLGSVMSPAVDRVPVEPGSSYPNVGIYSFGRGLFAKPDIDGSTTSAKMVNRIRAGQFIYSRLFAFEGAYANVPEEFDEFFVSNEFPAFDPDPEHLDARWLANYIRSPARWTELRGASKGLGVRRQRIPVEAVLAYEVWLPPIEQQRAVIASLGFLDSADTRRTESIQRLKALVPSAMNQALASLS